MGASESAQRKDFKYMVFLGTRARKYFISVLQSRRKKHTRICVFKTLLLKHHQNNWAHKIAGGCIMETN